MRSSAAGSGSSCCRSSRRDICSPRTPAFQDFPRLSSILARDRFMPSQFRNRGDRLVFSNGVLVLAGLATFLIWLYDAELTRLIQLYVIGSSRRSPVDRDGAPVVPVRGEVALARHAERRGRVRHGVVLVVATITKFSHGAYVVVIAIPIIVLLFLVDPSSLRADRRLLAAGRFTGDVRRRTRSCCWSATSARRRSTPCPTCSRSARRRSRRLWVGPPEAFDDAQERWRRCAAVRRARGAARRGEHLVRAVRGT